MDIAEAIEKRISRRAYSQEPISEHDIEILQTTVDNINEESGLSIKFVKEGRELFANFLGSYGVFSNVQYVFAMTGPESLQNLYEKVGYFGERLVLEATKLGLGTCWIAGTYDKKKMSSVVNKSEKLVCIITVGHIEDKMGFKEKALISVVKRKTKPVEALYKSKEPLPQWFLDGIKSVQKAPSAANRQPVTFEYSHDKVTASVPKKFNHELIDLGIAKYHFEIMSGYKFED